MPSGSSSRSDRLRIWLERGESGFWLRDAESGAALRWDDERLRVMKLAGSSYRLDELQDEAFEPGRRLALVRSIVRNGWSPRIFSGNAARAFSRVSAAMKSKICRPMTSSRA